MVSSDGVGIARAPGFMAQLGQPGVAIDRLAPDHVGGEALADLEDQRVVRLGLGAWLEASRRQQPRIRRCGLGWGRRAGGARRP